MLLSIVDESLTNPLDKLKCMLFARELSLLPGANIGDIIRLHRLKVGTWQHTWGYLVKKINFKGNPKWTS